MLVALAVCGGEEEEKEKASGPFGSCEAVHATSSKALAEQMILDELLVYIDTGTPSHTFLIDPTTWRLLKYPQKDALIIALQVYSRCQFKNFWVVYVKDAYSGKLLGKSRGRGGSKIYND